MTTRKPRSTGGPKDNIVTWMDDQPVFEVEDDLTADVFPEAPGVPASPAPSRTEEVPPKVPSRTENLINRVRDRAKTATKRAPKPVTPPKARPPRKPVAGLIEGAWGILAQVASGINPPVARVLQLQAPVAGMMLEDSVKDTIIDRILQPLARTEGQGEVMFALLGPPILVGVATAKPELAPAIKPVLRQALKMWLKTAGPHLEKLQKEESEFEAKYGMQLEMMMYYIMTGEHGDQPPADYSTVAYDTAGTGNSDASTAGPTYPHNGAGSATPQGTVLFTS